ncbi:MAG: eL32 family ribosomal protein [Candidatus Nanoarchaeia archaeon]
MAKKFIRKDTHKKKRLPLNWRKPKGITNKKRLNVSGHTPNVRPGYGTKNTEKGKNKQGLMIIQVSTLEELKKINPKTQSALLSGVGKRKKLLLIEEAEKLKITLTNFNANKYKAKVQEFLSAKKQESAVKKTEKKTLEEKAEAETKEIKEKEEITPEQKKKEEKQEKDKILITKNNK